MGNRTFIGLLVGLVLPAVVMPSAAGQLRGTMGSGAGFGVRSSLPSGQVRQMQRLHSLQNNPIASPAPTITPHELLHPRGSVSDTQTLNPAPSLSRPRSGSSVLSGRTISSARSPRSAQAASVSTSRVNELAATLATSTRTGPASRTSRRRLASRLLMLEQELRTWPNGDLWVHYFRLPGASQQTKDTRDDVDQWLQTMLKRFRRTRSDEAYVKVSQLRAFQSALAELESALNDPQPRDTDF